MSTDSLKKFFVVLITFSTISSYAFSPIESKISAISEENSFLTGELKKKIMVMTITGYSSSYDETDDDPWITAYNTQVRWGVVASNVLPFGTKLKIPSLFGNQIFIVEDRMHPRFNENLDIWFPTKADALNFGIHRDVIIEIIE